MISQELIDELQVILSEEHGTQFDQEQVIEVAEFLTSYFGCLIKMKQKNKGEKYAIQTDASCEDF